MPNWCATNYRVVSGDPDDLKELEKIINKMTDAGDNGFGRLWLGNFFIAMGESYDEASENDCRGVIDPDPYACPCFCGPEPDCKTRINLKKGFSTITAWDRSVDFEETIRQNWPSIELAWISTDDMGNFFQVHDPSNKCNFARYYIETETEDFCFGLGQESDFLKTLYSIIGKQLPNFKDADELKSFVENDKCCDDFLEWRDEDLNHRDWYRYSIYEDV